MGVPAFSRDDLEAYAKSEDEIREWILDGMPRRLRQDPAPASSAEASLTPMPAWRDILCRREVDDLVAYIKAVGDVERPQDAGAEAGRATAERLGCFGCHGPQGRGAPPNPRSFKGYIPAWDGVDFPDLARSDAEVREWIVGRASTAASGAIGWPGSSWTVRSSRCPPIAVVSRPTRSSRSCVTSHGCGGSGEWPSRAARS